MAVDSDLLLECKKSLHALRVDGDGMKTPLKHRSSRPLAEGDLRARSLDLLDFDVIRQQLADHVTSPPARRLALELTPAYRVEKVRELQRETWEGRELLSVVGDLALSSSGIEEALLAIKRAALGGALSGAEILAVAECIDAQKRARSAVNGAGSAQREFPLLLAMAQGIPDFSELQQQIRERLGPRGEVLDEANPVLKDLRRRGRVAYERVAEALRRIIQSSAGQETLQDQVVSIRGDRLVLQVKAEMRYRLPGIVHDASNSGATLFIEPFATVELCNNWRELVLEEEREVNRVLRHLSEQLGGRAEDILRGAELVARLDLIFGRARYSAAIGGLSETPRISGQKAGVHGETGPVVHLVNARHPLLRKDAVPITVDLGPGWSTLVITGPNTGGKTVAMKTVGILALMHQSGIQIPAEQGSALPVFDGIYADIGDQQSIDQSVSTFGSHMLNVIEILNEAGLSSLVLLDELGTSTDPEEGSALAKAILDHLRSRSIPTIVTTHHRTVANYAEGVPGMMNASVELDPTQLTPTYKLTMGVPGRSYAMSVASRLGLPEEILNSAYSLLEPQYRRFEDWLGELQNERHMLQLKLAEVDRAHQHVEALRADLRSQVEYLTSHRDDILESVRRHLLAYYDDVRRKLQRVEASLSWKLSDGDLRDARAHLAEARKEFKSSESGQPTRSDTGINRLVVGDLVRIKGLNLNGTVASISQQDGEAEVTIGNVRLRVDPSRLSHADQGCTEQPSSVHLQLGPGLATTELDLRGLRVEAAVMQLEEFLDKAVRDGLSSVRIIHGGGTGALRGAVREQLSRHPLSRSFGAEVRERGGNGVTVVELA